MACVYSSVNHAILFTCLIGLGLSYYAYFVETNLELDENYEALCDISEHMSCGKVFMSKYGKGFGFVGHLLGEDSIFNQPNGLGGMIFFSIVALLSCFNTLPAVKIQIGLCIISNLMSIYLAYILLFILYDFCLVCVGTYIVNFVNLLLATAKHSQLAAAKSTQNRKKKIR